MNVLAPFGGPSRPPQEARSSCGVCFLFALGVSLLLWVGIGFGVKECVEAGIDLWKPKELSSTAPRLAPSFASIASTGIIPSRSTRKFSARTN